MALKNVSTPRSFDRRLFAVAAVLFPLLVIAGFARTYYLRGFFDVPPVGPLLVHLHGILMSAWVVLFVAQIWLISSARVRLHRKFGLASIGFAVLIIVVGFLTAVRAAKFGASAAPINVPRLPFLLIPLTDLLMFAILFGAAIYFRKKPANHKRLMLLTAINFVPPAIARIPSASLQALGPIWFFGFPTVLALAVLAIDTYQNKKLNRVFLMGTLLMILSFVARLAVMGTDTWIAIAQWLTTWAA